VNFGNSVTWLVNPAYQILKMSKDGRFIGKINFTLGNLDGKDAIIIDALEFNPQAVEGKPYYQDGLDCFDAVLGFLKDLAQKENRTLFALTVSNSSGAVELFRERGKDLTRFQEIVSQRPSKPLVGTGMFSQINANEALHELDSAIQDAIKKGHKQHVLLTLLIPNDDVTRILKTSGYSGEVKFFYQMLDSLVDSRSKRGKDLTDTKLPALEREVINPMQIANAEVAAAMSARDFEKAAQLILADSEASEKVKAIFGLPKGMGISPKFLSVRLEKLYHTQALDATSLRRTFKVDADYFVKL